MSSPSLRKKSNEIIYQAARCTEVVVSVIIFTVIIISLFSLLYDLTQLSFLDMSESFFNTFLSRSLGLVVGLESVSYTHLDVYKRQPLARPFPAAIPSTAVPCPLRSLLGTSCSRSSFSPACSA